MIGTQTVPMLGTSTSTLEVPGLDICTQYWFIARAATCAVEAFSEPFQVTLRDTASFEFVFTLSDNDGSCDNWIKEDTMDKISAFESSLLSVLDSTVCNFIQVGCFAQSAFSCEDEDDAKTVTFR